MKKTLIITLFLITHTFLLLAQEEDFLINEVMTRSEMITSIPIHKMGSFARKNLSPQIQAKLWMIKINDTLKNANLSEGEKKHIRKYLIPYITPESFVENSKDNRSLSLKTKKLERVLRSKYDWDDEKVFVFLIIFYTLDEYKKYREMEIQQIK